MNTIGSFFTYVIFILTSLCLTPIIFTIVLSVIISILGVSAIYFHTLRTLIKDLVSN